MLSTFTSDVPIYEFYLNHGASDDSVELGIDVHNKLFGAKELRLVC